MSDKKIEKTEEPKENPANAKLRVLEKKVDAMTRFLETMFNFDINKDGKIGLILVGFLLSAATTFALSPITNAVFPLVDMTATNVIYDIDTSGNVRAAGSVTASGAISGTSVTGTGPLTVPSASAGDVSVSTNIDYAVSSQSVTNGQFISVVSSWIELSNVGQASTTTTNPLPASYSTAQVGRMLYIQAAAANTDSIHIAESAVNVMTATNLTLTANDTVSFQIVATNLARQTSAVNVN